MRHGEKGGAEERRDEEIVEEQANWVRVLIRTRKPFRYTQTRNK